MRKLDVLTMVLLIVGGLNWLLVGAANFDLVAALFGEMTLLSRIVYILVGLSAVYQAVMWSSVRRRTGATLAVAALIGLSSVGTEPLAAQESDTKLFVEGRAGVVVPTFDIADVATSGPAFGATIGYNVGPRLVVMGEFDYGMHEDEATGTVDITTMHYMAKVGYSLTGPRERGLEAVVNLGAGAVSFDVEGGETYTYPAINAGAKIAYNFNRSFAAVLSPQGDIAFADEDELGTTNAWVWPVTAGVRVKF